jgi:hypothetical protein
MRKLCVAMSGAFVLMLAPAARADDQADAKAIIEKALKAHGGADKLGKIKAYTSKMKGKVHVMGLDLDFTGSTSVQEPDKMRVEIEAEVMGMKVTSLQVFNKDKAWVSVNGTTMELDKDAIEAFKEKLYLGEVGRMVNLTDKKFKLSTVGEVKVAGKEAIGVRIECKGHADVSLFFDKKTNLLVKTETREKDPASGTEFATETIVSDYKVVDGVQIAHKAEVKRDDKPFVEAEISGYKIEKELSDTLFEKP